MVFSLASEEWWRWWRRNRRKFIVGAAAGVALDVPILYFLFTSQYTGSFFFQYAVAALIGILIGLVAIEIFSFSPKLWPKLAAYVGNHQTKLPQNRPSSQYRKALAFNMIMMVTLIVFAFVGKYNPGVGKQGNFETVFFALVIVFLISFVFLLVSLVRAFRKGTSRDTV